MKTRNRSVTITEFCYDVRRTTRPSCYAVWALLTNGLTTLRAISLSAPTANQYRKTIMNSPRTVKAWIEIREVDHLYGETECEMMDQIDRRELHRLAEQLPLVEPPESKLLPHEIVRQEAESKSHKKAITDSISTKRIGKTCGKEFVKKKGSTA